LAKIKSKNRSLKILAKLKHFSELVMLSHTVFSLPFILIAMVVASHGLPSLSLLLLGILAAFFARSFAMGVNRFADRKFDAKNPRTASRPSVDGRVSAPTQLFFIALSGLGFIVVSFIINSLAFKLSFAFLPILAAYSYFKRFSSAAHLVLGLSLALAPIAGEIAVSESISLWSLCLAAGVLFWVAGFDIFYALQDMEFDKKEGLYSIPSVFGEAKAMSFAALFHTFTVIFWFLFVKFAALSFISMSGVLLAAALLFAEHYLVRRDKGTINKAFFTMNGYLGILFFALVTIDIWINR
jgi:4-hydroxybenzoate polyprenyltransferase